ncbi:MAG: hypothetical protein AB7S71_18230 [Dongiaceae bacterium]
MSDEAEIIVVDTAPATLPAADGEALPLKRGPGRPKGVRNRDRVATIERVNKEADPLGFRIRALRRGWVKAAPDEKARHREKIPLTKDEMLKLSRELEDKVLPRLRSFEVSGVGDVTTNNVLVNHFSVNSTEGEQKVANLLRRAMLRNPDLVPTLEPEAADAAE